MRVSILWLLVAITGAGVLAAWLADRPSTAVPEITVGGFETPLPPPRVRVRNTDSSVVAVAYATDDGSELEQIGIVPGLATMTFPLPEGLGAVRIVVREEEPSGERFTSDVIDCDRDTDVTVIVAATLERSVLEVARLRVIRDL